MWKVTIKTNSRESVHRLRYDQALWIVSALSNVPESRISGIIWRALGVPRYTYAGHGMVVTMEAIDGNSRIRRVQNPQSTQPAASS